MRRIAFQPDMAIAILDRQKVLTTRQITNTLRLGEEISARTPNRFGDEFAVLKITGIRLIVPQLAAQEVASAEGFESTEAYLKKLRIVNPKVDLMAEHKLITFELVRGFPAVIARWRK